MNNKAVQFYKNCGIQNMKEINTPISRIEMAHATFESTLVSHPPVYPRMRMYKRIRVSKLVLPLNLVTIFGKFFNKTHTVFQIKHYFGVCLIWHAQVYLVKNTDKRNYNEITNDQNYDVTSCFELRQFYEHDFCRTVYTPVIHSFCLYVQRAFLKYY